jgi:hypothetical protein
MCVAPQEFDQQCPIGAHVIGWSGSVEDGWGVRHLRLNCSDGVQLPQIGNTGPTASNSKEVEGYSGIDTYMGDWLDVIWLVARNSSISGYGKADFNTATTWRCLGGECTAWCYWMLNSIACNRCGACQLAI